MNTLSVCADGPSGAATVCLVRKCCIVKAKFETVVSSMIADSIELAEEGIECDNSSLQLIEQILAESE